MPLRALHLICTGLLSCLSAVSMAQPAGLLYDPEPPEDSAYVRIIVASKAAAFDVQVDGHLRQTKQAAMQAGDYLVIPAGKHSLSLHAAGKAAALASHTLNVVAGRAMTIAFPELNKSTTVQVFEDKANTNKLRALLSVYHLAPKLGSVDILTADGKTKVFTAMSVGSSNAIPVNPISIALMAAASDTQTALAHTELSMSQGGTYSVFLLPGNGKNAEMRVFQNKIERYTGK